MARTKTGLWLGDNGRITCDAPKCAGMTAHFSGMRRDLSGGPLDELTVADWREISRLADGREPRCEGCGKRASLLAAA